MNPIENPMNVDYANLVKTPHPIIWTFTFLFKGSSFCFSITLGISLLIYLGLPLGLAVALYLLGGILQTYFVVVFVLLIILLAFDFWFVKNVSGRFLVGYRWWNDVQEDGKSVWRYETIPVCFFSSV
jgi:hypothetical protein